ncbi:MAG TPA: hypothetical protein PKY05_06130 [Fibrobacteria bacterium]|nr:hypothetical protein [Fibrobacteria bacterium]
MRIGNTTWSVLALAGAIGAQAPLPSSGPQAPSGTVVSTPPASPTVAPTATIPPPAQVQGNADTAQAQKPTAKPAGGASVASPSGADEGFQFHPGLSFGTLTVDGKTWTRLAFTPEVSFGKLGVGFNMELFLDESQNLATKGWEFDTPEQTLESVLRKVDYVRWAHPKDPLYLRLGTLNGIDLGRGLVASGYGNMARYPDYKLLGLHAQINDVTSVGLDLEAVVNNLQDLDNGGPFTAVRAGFRPLKPSGMPMLGGLAIGFGAAYDWNQYAGLRDLDADGCPDGVDWAPDDDASCVAPLDQADYKNSALLDQTLPLGIANQKADSIRHSREGALKDRYSASKPFAIYWAEASLPIITTEVLGLDVYSVFAKPQTSDPQAVDAGWGMIPVGAGSCFGPIRMMAEYRLFNAPFQPGHFNASYDADRARFVQGSAVTKEIAIYGDGNAQEGWLQGYFAGAQWDVFQFLTLAADYSHMFPSRSSQEELRSAGGRIALGKAGASLLRKISTAELYWRKDRIGLDQRPVNEGGVVRLKGDAFFDNSLYTLYGVRVGSQIAPGLELVVDRQTSFNVDLDGSLKREHQMRVETRFVF